MRHLGLSLLGGFEADLDGEPITAFGTDKVRGLLVYLAVEADHLHRREELASLFWAEKPERTARKSLRQGLTMLRGALDDRDAEVPFLLVTRQTVQWNPAANCSVDSVLFAQLVAQSLDEPLTGDDILELERAVGLYKGEFLAGFSLSGCLKFEEWVRQEHQSLHQQMLVALDRLTVYYSGQQEYVKTILYAQRQIALEPWREAAHRQLMSALANSGQRNQALAQYGTCTRLLWEELAVEPQPETTALYEQIRATTRPRPMIGQPAGGLGLQEAVSVSPLAKEATQRQASVEEKMKQALSAPPPAPTVPMYNFPLQFTPFIGRESELTQILRQLTNPACRLLTLIGPGGIGKTSLSIEVASWLSENMLGFFDGIYFVPLADVATSDLLLVSLANSLGLTWQESAEPKPQLLNYLRSKNCLLVLDNLEHLLSGGDLLLEILMAAPNVKMLVTSREPLNLRVEWRQHLDGLAYPSEPEQLTRSSYSAVQLFVQAAAQVQPGFCATPDEQAAIVRICQLLQGMPLGIELSAAWVRFYDCDTIAQKIAENLDFLVTPLRDMPERHRSMRAVFEHSWKLLSASEQQLLAQVSIFRGGFTFDAALAITNATHRQAQGTARVDLMALLDKSLLRRTAEERIVVHELLRQFVAERFDETQDDQKVRDRHAAYYSTFLQVHAAALRGANQPKSPQDALAKIGQEIENVRLAWQWAVQHAKFDYIEQSLDSLFSFYEIRSWFQEGEATFRKAVHHLQHLSAPKNRSEQADPKGLWLEVRLVWKMVARQGVFCHRLGHYEQAKALLQKSLDALSAPGTNSGFGATSAPKKGGDEDEAERAFCLSNLASVSISQGQYHIAKPLLEDAIELARQAQLAFSSSPRALAIEADSLRELGNICWHEGDYVQAETYYQKALSIYRAPSMAHQRGEAWALNRLGFVAWSGGDYVQAQAYHERALQIFRSIGNQQGEATVLNHLGTVLEQQGYYSDAKANYSQGLRIFRQVGDLQRESIGLSNLGFVCHHYGNYHEAKGYFEQMLYLTRQIGYRRGESLANACLGLLFHQLADNQAALAYSQQALQITREIGNRTIEGYALTHLGHALTELGDLAQAAATYQEAISLRQELGKPNLTMEAVAGLARVYLALGDLPQALAQVEKILSHLERDTLAGTLDPFRVYLTCYRVLRSHDAQTKQRRAAQKLLRRAVKELQMYANKISDEQMRRSYLLDVVAHRDIMRQSLPSPNIHHASEGVNEKTHTTQSPARFSNVLAAV
ncbi:MAG: AfsR/SARP family transcriptional regulator [Ardenticatenaceae bacterium]